MSFSQQAIEREHIAYNHCGGGQQLSIEIYLKELFKRSILVFLLELCTRLACGFLEEPHQM